MNRNLFTTLPLLVVLALPIAPAAAQEVTPEPTVEVTAEPTPPPDVALPDLDPVVDETQTELDVFINAAATGVAMAFVAFLIIQGGKWLLPEHFLRTEWIYGLVVTAFCIIYLLAARIGFEQQLTSVVEWLAAAAPSVIALLTLVFGAPAFSNAARELNIPGLSEKQGKKALSFKPEDDHRASPPPAVDYGRG